MRVRHGGIALDVPDGWSDQSTLLFVAPRPESTALSAKASAAPTEAVSVCFAIADASPDELAARHAGSVANVDSAHRIKDAPPIETQLGRAAMKIVTMTLGGVAVRQYVIAVVVSGIAVLASAACLEQRASEREPDLLAMLASLGSAKGSP